MISHATQIIDPSLAGEVAAILARCGVEVAALSDGELAVRSPISGETLARVKTVDATTASKAVENAHSAFLEWRLVPAPKRGELIRLLGEELRAAKADLGRLVSIEVGKIPRKAWARSRR